MIPHTADFDTAYATCLARASFAAFHLPADKLDEEENGGRVNLQVGHTVSGPNWRMTLYGPTGSWAATIINAVPKSRYRASISIRCLPSSDEPATLSGCSTE